MTRNEIVRNLKDALENIDTLISFLTEDGLGDKEKTIGEELDCYKNLLTTDYESVIVELFGKYRDETIGTFKEELKKEI